MRSVIATFAAATLLVAGFSGTALAKGATQEFSGQITRVNPTSHTLAAKATAKPNEEMLFTLAPDAKIMSNAKTTTLASLAVGQHVVVKYSNEGSKHEAYQVDAQAKAAGKPSYGSPSTKK